MRIAAFALALLACAGVAHSQAYPAKLIRFVTVAPPGSSIDLTARTVADLMAKSLGQPIVVEARIGAGGVVAARHVMAAEPDGHTVLLHGSSHVTNPVLSANAGYELKDFAGVTSLAILPSVLVAPPARGWKTAAELIAAARGKPGHNYASAGNGSSPHMSAELFRMRAGIVEGQHVPYKGTAEAITDTVAGRTDWFFSPIAQALPLIKDGSLRALAITGAQTRSPHLPDVPTLAEQGLANADYKFWVGMSLPAKTPRAVVQKLNEEAVRAVRLPEVQERFARTGAEAMTMKSDEFEVFMKSELELTAAIVKAANIRAQ
jgi:tripartite-type tricarboxylate transporter receptor subunit TctC